MCTCADVTLGSEVVLFQSITCKATVFCVARQAGCGLLQVSWTKQNTPHGMPKPRSSDACQIYLDNSEPASLIMVVSKKPDLGGSVD